MYAFFSSDGLETNHQAANFGSNDSRFRGWKSKAAWRPMTVPVARCWSLWRRPLRDGDILGYYWDILAIIDIGPWFLGCFDGSFDGMWKRKKVWIIGGQDSMIWDVLMVLFYVIAMDLWENTLYGHGLMAWWVGWSKHGQNGEFITIPSLGG